jgi:hypothetical protein
MARSLSVDIAEDAVFATTTKQAELQKITSLASIKKLSQYEEPILTQLKNVNVARYTEDLSWVYHVINNASYGNKTNELMTAIIDSKEVVLNRFVGKSFNCLLESKYTNVPLNIFVTGQLYMFSMYVYSDVDQWFLNRALSVSTSAAHDYKFCPAGKVTRVWGIGKATSAVLLDLGAVATVAYGSGSGASHCLVSQGHQTFDAYIGGFQIEAISNSSYVDGIAIIGDSTFAISSGGAATDMGKNFATLSNREVSHTLSGILNCCVFNRAVAGETLAQMDARWATDITTIKPRCKYVIIQGGINDINTGRTLAQMQASVQSMISKALADGFTDYVLPNVTPNSYCDGDSAKEALRLQYNAWLLATYPTKCKDIASVVADATVSKKLRAEYYGDGIHYGGAAKFAVATYLASVCGFVFESPTAYKQSDAPYVVADWIRESTTVVAAGATISGSSRRVISSGTTSGSAKLAPTKFSAIGGADLAGIVAIQASSDGGTTWYPVAQTTMSQVNGAGNYGGYIESPIVESVMRGILTNTSGSTQTSVVLSTRVF